MIKGTKRLLILVAAIFAGSAWLGLQVPFEWVPSVDSSSIAISAPWPGASPRAVERHVVVPIEQIVQSIPGTARVESHSREGAGFVRLWISDDREPALYLAEVYDRIAALRGVLPWGVLPRVSRGVPEALQDEQDFMVLQVVGDMDPVDLRSIAEAVGSRLRSLEGVSEVAVEGGQEREILVNLRGDRLAAYGISVLDLEKTLREALAERSYGWLRVEGRQVLAWQPGARSAFELSRVPVGTGSPAGRVLRLADVGGSSLGPAPVHTISRVDGKPVVVLRLNRVQESHLPEVAARVREMVDELQGEWSGVEILVADDRSEELEKKLDDLALRGGLGLLSIALVLACALRSGRAVGLVLACAALSLSIGVALLHLLGLTVNILTLAGLSLLIGFLVDNAIVVTEGILRRKSSAGPMWPPLVGGTLSTIIVFLPLVYLSGELKSLLAPFAVLATITLVASLLSAGFLIPALAPVLATAPVARSERTHGGRLLPLAIFSFGIRHPRLLFLLLLLAVGLPTPLLPISEEEPDGGWASAEEQRAAERYNATMGSEPVRRIRQWADPVLGGVTRPFVDTVDFGGEWDLDDRPQLFTTLRLPPGSGIERAEERIRRFEESARGLGGIRRTLTRVNGDTASFQILFDDDAAQGGEPLRLREDLVAQALQVAGMDVIISGLVPTSFHSGLGDVAGFLVEAYGSSYEDLEKVTAAFAKRLAYDPRVAEVDTNAGRYAGTTGREVLSLVWGSQAIARTGIKAGELSSLLRTRILTQTPAFYVHFEGSPRLPVRLVAAGSGDEELHRLMETPFQAGGGDERWLRLAGFGALTSQREPVAIERLDQQYKRYIRVYYRGPFKMGRRMILQQIEQMPLPAGYRLEMPAHGLLAGQTKLRLIGFLAGALALVFLVIAAALESWRSAACVMVCVPAAWIGIALGFLWMEAPFGEGAFLGSILTLGLSVNAGIFLAHRYLQLRRARPNASPGLLALLSIRNRWRPMWTSTLCSVVALIPILLLPGAEPFWIGLAVSVVGGLLSSTALVPLAMVALFSRWSWTAEDSSSAPPPLSPSPG